MEVTVLDILNARDRRVEKQKELLQKYGKPLICFTMNIPGPVKVSSDIRAAFKIGDNFLHHLFKVVYEEDTSADTGYEKFYIVDQDPACIKRSCIAIESIISCGRLFDMDVLTTDGQKLSRETPRKCLICEKDAAICGRSRAHSVEELQAATNKLLETRAQEMIWRLATDALMAEAKTTPKPGLVDCSNSGSHRDMDIDLFLDSADTLFPYFLRCTRIALDHSDPKELFRQLRPLGMTAEKEMLEATGGVNTHKGAIFTMGVAAAAAARCFPDTRPETVLEYCARMTEGLVKQDFGGITTPKTAGERLYVEHGITGIRGQAEQGFPAVLNVGLPVLQEGLSRGLSLNDAGCATLLHLLAVTDDTNMVSRSDLATLREIQSRLQVLLASDPYPNLSIIEELDREFIERNLSPGGSADLLALTYFLHFLNN